MPPLSKAKKAALKEFKSIDGIGDVSARKLLDAGYMKLSELQSADDKDLTDAGLNDKIISNIRDSIIPILLRGERSIVAPVDQFIFDGQNHRFIGQTAASSCRSVWADFGKATAIKKIDDALWQHFKVPELFNNMKKNGISFQDRIVVAEWPKPSNANPSDKKYVVLEGNRRLCAFRRLKSEAGVSTHIRSQLDGIQAVEMVYSDREELLERAKAMMAVRHLCGLEEWGAFAQAVMKKEAVEKYGNNAAAANHLGVSTQSVSQDLEAIHLFEDIQDNFGNLLDSTSDFASCVELCNPALRKWLGTEHTYDVSTDTIENPDKMKIFLRKWKSNPTGKVDSGRLVGGATAFRPLKKVLKSGDAVIINDWEDGTIDLSQAVMQVDAKNVKGAWPGTVNAAIDTIKSLNGTKLREMDKEEVGKLESVMEKAGEQMKIRKILVKADVKGMKVLKLREMCLNRGLSNTGIKKDLQNRLIKGID